MSRPSARFVVPLASVAFVSLVLLAPRLAWSQSQGGAIDMQLFRPAIDTKGLITLDSHEPLAHLALSLRTNLAYAYRPFALSGTPKGGTWCSDGTTNCLPADPTYVLSRYRIDHLVTGYLGGAIGLFKRFEVGFGFPIGFWLGSSEPSPQQGVDKLDIGRDSALGLGDITLHLKAKIFGERRFGMGLGTRLTVAFPTGRDDAFLGSGRFRVTPVILADRHFWKRRIHLAFNLGAHLRFGGETQPWVDTRLCQVPGSVGNADCGTGRVLETTHHLFYGAGMALTVVRKRLELLAEFIGQTGFNGFYDLDPEGALVSAHEVLVGMRIRLLGRTFFEAGAGMGLNRGDANIQYGSPRFRAYFGLSIEATLRYAKEQAKKIGNLAPVKAMIEKYREKAQAKLAEYVAQAKKKVEDKAKEVALAAISKALESSLAGDAQALVEEVLERRPV